MIGSTCRCRPAVGTTVRFPMFHDCFTVYASLFNCVYACPPSRAVFLEAGAGEKKTHGLSG